MNDRVDVVVAGRLQRALIVGEEVVTAPTPLDPGTGREVEAQVGIGEQQQADGPRLVGERGR